MELWRDLLISKIAKNKYKLIFLSLGLFSWYLFDAFYRPTYTHEFPFTQGEHVWNVDVRKDCGYTLGFTFTVPDDYAGDLNQLFGNLGLLKTLSASFTVNIFNSHGDKLLMRVPPPGKKSFSFVYKSNYKTIDLASRGGGYSKEDDNLTYRFIALSGMNPGKYKVEINISDVSSELSGFKTSMFLSSSIKFTCS